MVTTGCDITGRGQWLFVRTWLRTEPEFTAQQVSCKHTQLDELRVLCVFIETFNHPNLSRITSQEQKITFKGQQHKKNSEGTENMLFSAGSFVK